MLGWLRLPRQQHCLSTEARITWRDLSVRPTKLGLSLLGIAGAMWLTALNYSVNLAYGLAFWLLAIWLLAVLLTMRQLLGAKVNIRLPDETFAGETAVFAVSLQGQDNRERVVMARWLAPDVDEASASALSEDDVQFIRVDAQGSAAVHLPLLAQWRGYRLLPDVQLLSTAPFGLFEVQTRLHDDSEWLVYPAAQAHPTPNTEVPLVADEAASRYRSGGDDVAYLQDYQPGQSLQQVAWKAYAKTGVMVSKHLEEPVQARPQVISYRDYPAHTPTEALASMLCWRVLQAEAARAVYTLELPRVRLGPQNRQRERCLTALSLL